MAKFKEFTSIDGDPILINFDNVTSVHLEVVRRGDPHEKVSTIISLMAGGRVRINEPFNDVREWLMGTIS